MNLAIVDDCAADRLRLEQTLKEYGSIHRLELHTDHFSGGEALLQTYQPFAYTVVFLDIYMDGISGIETAERIRAVDEDSAIVFMTTSEEHRSAAFSVFAVGYLSKPFADAEVFRILDHILRLRTDGENRFTFSYDRQSHSLRCADIASIETDGNYLVICDRRGERYRTRMTFSYAQTQIDSRFLTLMKGIMVNMDCIEQIKKTICILQDGRTFPIHVKNEKELKQKWLNYKFAAIRKATETAGVNNGC